ncbi:T1SS secreted agglutinin RTX (plasmid) [Sinorhizobium sojae CCBAU 05684]|uniref:T1SS secreted agglutinin RTX n=1 Tax=Sinorhizobium sojae CCBAU 05684 TaxID=716928 RepID=A0A249PJI9_9HYPH|nr:T1SS secreted agglutinin RTX [Sinorhizobium sojae CCBAU 05684]
MQFLDAGETITLSFEVTVTDDDGATDTQTVTITINGTNDAPVIEATATGAVTEDLAVDGSGNLTTSGTITLADVDTNETLTVTNAPTGQPSWSGGSLTQTQADTLLAGFTATATGWNYQVPNALVQFLDAGETITLSFEVTVTDDDGATDTQTVTITINGTNDAPVIEATATGAVTEDLAVDGSGNLTTSGTITLADVDTNETLTVTNAPTGQPSWSGGSLTQTQADTLLAGFTATATGWNYQVPNALVQFLDAGETITLSFEVTVTDDDGATDTQTVTITINGTNDAPVIEATATGAVTEDLAVDGSGNLTTSGTITLADVDTNETLTVTNAPTGQPSWSGGSLTQTQADTLLAGFTATATGWNYQVPNALVQFLDAGETITLSFEVTVTDDDGATDTQTVTITINGTNDAPVIEATATGAVTEDLAVDGSGNLTTSGTITLADVDTNETLTVTNAPTGQPSWSGGSLTQTQADTLLAGFTATATGWNYQVPNALVQFLDAGETITLSFEVTVTDDDGATDTQTVTITINGTNDAPVIEATATGAVTEDLAVDGSGNLTTSGTITLADVDTNETLTVTNAPTGQPSWSGGSLTQTQADTLLAGFTATATGWNYQVPNALVQFLDAGETITLSFEVTVTDDDGATDTQTVTITINGTNDAPVIEATATGAVTEDLAVDGSGNLTTSGTITLADVDTNETLTVTNAPTGQPSWSGGSLTQTQADTLLAGFTATATGWNYQVPNALVQFLDAGETITLSFEVTVTDDDGATDTQTVTITINGTNDAPVIEATATGAVTEDLAVDGSGNLTTSGTITLADVDTNETLTVTNAPTGQPSWSGGSLTQTQADTLLAGFTATATGWNYQVPNALVQFLDAGETITLSFEVTVTDDDGATDTQTVTITINGTNDAPVVASSCVWLPSDPAQQGSEYASGYPLMVSTPTDVDGENVIVTATNSPSGVYYFDGSNYVAVTANTVLYDPANGINLLDNLIYRPTSAINDTPSVSLNLSASDGSQSTAYSVTINEVAPTTVPGPVGTISDNSGPLTSGRNASASAELGSSFASAITADPSDGSLTLLTNFQEWSRKGLNDSTGTYATVNSQDQNGDFLEKQVNVFVYVDGVKFQVVVANDANPDNWTFDGTTGLMKTEVDFDFIINTSDPSQTLAQYLSIPGNEPQASDVWSVEYDDTKGGNEQARYFKFEFSKFDPGDPGIVVVGDDTKSNLIYGTSGADNLTGGALDDTIIGRDGNDVINGGGGSDTLRGGSGNDTIDGGAGVDLLDLSDASAGVTFSLVQSSGNTVADLTAVGLGVDTYRNVEGLIGSDYNDTLIGSAFDDKLYAGAGSDTLTGGAGADIFVIADDELQLGIDDVITDYDAAEGDVVDLSALLGELASGTLDQHVQVVQDGANANLQVDTDGGGDTWQTVAVLENFSVSDEVVKILFNESGTKTTGEV